MNFFKSKLNFNLYSTIEVLVFLFPIFFILRSFTLNFFISLVTILYIIYFFKKYSLFKFKFLSYLIFIYFFYFIILNLFLNLDVILILKSILLIRYPIFFFCIIYVLKKCDLKNIKNLILLNILFSFFFSFDLIYQYINSTNLFGFKGTLCNELSCLRFSGLFNDEYVAGYYFSTVIFSIFIIIKYFYKYFFLNFVPLFFCAIISITGERSAFIMILILSFFYYAFIFYGNKKKLLLSIILFFSLIFSLVQIDLVKKRFKDIYYLSFSSNLKKVDSFLTTPWMLHYRASIKLIEEKPLFGHGLYSYRSKCKNFLYLNTRVENNNKHNVCSTHPHNFHIQILLNSGIIGFILFFLFFLLKILEFLKLKNKNNFYYYIIFVIIIFVFLPRPTGSIFSTFFSTSFWYTLGILFGLSERENEK